MGMSLALMISSRLCVRLKECLVDLMATNSPAMVASVLIVLTLTMFSMACIMSPGSISVAIALICHVSSMGATVVIMLPFIASVLFIAGRFTLSAASVVAYMATISPLTIIVCAMFGIVNRTSGVIATVDLVAAIATVVIVVWMSPSGMLAAADVC